MGLFDLILNKGKATTEKPAKVVAKHSQPKPDRSIEGISKQTLLQRDSIRKNGFTEYKFHANSDCCEICSKLNGKHFPLSALEIGVNAPPMHEKCKCSISAYSDRKEFDQKCREAVRKIEENIRHNYQFYS